MTDRDDRFGWEHLLRMREGAALFNRGLHWECHEALEAPWAEYAGRRVRYVFWAVIQVAAALCHLGRGNHEGARGQAGLALGKFERCERGGVETPLLMRCLRWSRLKSLVRALPPQASPRHFGPLSTFRFQDPPLWSRGDAP